MDDEIMGHADLYSIINKETFPEVYILTTPTDALLYNEAVKYDQFLSENNIAHVYKEYVGKENEIGHVFNIKKYGLCREYRSKSGYCKLSAGKNRAVITKT